MKTEDQETKLEFHQYFEMLPIPDTLKEYFKLADEPTSNYIKPLKKVNIFIGENNSGKSWLQRELLKQDLLRFNYDTDTFNEISEYFKGNYTFFLDQLDQIKKSRENFPELAEEADPNSILNLNYLKNQIDTINSKYFNQDAFDVISYINEFNALLKHLESDSNISQVYNDKSNRRTQKDIMSKVQLLKQLNNKISNQLLSRINLNPEFNSIYIPIMRTVVETLLNQDTFAKYIRTEYQIQSENFYAGNQIPNSENKDINLLDRLSKSVIISLGDKLLEDLCRKLLTNSSTRKDLADFELFIGENFYQGKSISITPGKYGDKKSVEGQGKDINIKIGEDDELPIHKLGTGIQMMIILTWPLFNYPNGMIFIEEPELYLHPRFQHQLMRIYATHERAKNFQFFINTHSNHIIDHVTDLDNFSLFTVSKNSADDFSIRNVPFGNSQPLQLLGVRPSSIAVANCIIWVEGPSDRIYINKWIEIFNNENNYKEKLKTKHTNLIEGVHYQINIYGGSIISHYTCSEGNENTEASDNLINILKINPNAIFVADNDLGEKRKELKINLKRIKEEIEMTQSHIWITQEKEIENYIPNPILETFDKKTDEESQSEKKQVSTFDIIKSKYIIDSKYNSKVQFAEYIASKMNYDNLHNHLDLKKQMELVLDKIYLWNHIVV